ncbi:hypothetical protein KVR01_006426 [Diaporthe batatas]|uniref:uncharacterized protein n=1 Tax=Diaporthe batatas TaxID=748121 RepID=UPI001D046585|nr:uncharacterized protein KVR01_006426 [Diaporthe batatas]KAG8164508.1 hypothetical protein KVR01_006426 [Diaporthe batatas]
MKWCKKLRRKLKSPKAHTKSANMTSKLLEVPAEILACIADDLDIEDYGNLRLANRQVHDYTFPYFAKKFFDRRKFYRGHLSLRTLLSISESRLGPFLETVILSTELLESSPPTDAPNVSMEACYRAYAEQSSMLACGWDRDTLIDAFRNLPNLKSVGVESFDDSEIWDPEDGHQSIIDGGYGLKTVLRSLGYEDGRPPRQPSSESQCVTAVQTLLGAVAKSGARPKGFSVTGSANGSYMGGHTWGVDDDAFVIPTFLEQTLVPVIEELEELILEVNNRILYPNPSDPATCRTCHLRRFLGLPKKLKRLRIAHLTGHMTSFDSPEERGQFWQWLGWSPKGKGNALPNDDESESDDEENRQPQWERTPTNAANTLLSPPPISLPHLQELYLDSQDILPANLTRLLNKVSPTLVRLNLCDLNLRYRAVRMDDSEDEVDRVVAEVNRWIELVGRIAAMPIDELREVTFVGFGGLGAWHLNKFADEIDATPDSVHFKVLKIVGDNSYNGQAEFSYAGSDVRGALRQLEADLRAALRDGRHVFVSEPPKRRNSF